MVRFMSLLGAAVILITGCGGSDPTESSLPLGSPTAPSDAPPSDAPPSDAELLIDLERVAIDLLEPTAAVAVPPELYGSDSTMLIAERGGVVRVLDVGPATPSLSDPVIDISSDVTTGTEQGLLGVAITPPPDARLLLSYTNGEGNTRLDSYSVSARSVETPGNPPLVVDPSTRRNLLAVDQPFSNHNGGHIEIGPDGLLYMGLGDGGSGGDPHGNAQDRSTLLGKLIRLDPYADSAGAAVPDDNPFVGVRGVRPEIWATGLRNPWRFSFDPVTGDLWLADVGQDRFEEIDHVTAASGGARGANFGWDLFEGHEPFADADPAPPPASDGPFVEPVHVYGHGPGCSITGGRVYRGATIPGLVGMYLFSDFCDGTIRALETRPDGTTHSRDLGVEVDQPVGFAEDLRGEQYVISLSSGVHRIIPVE